MKTIKDQLDAGRVNDVIAGLKPYRRRSEAVAACIRTYEANNDRMHYDLWRKRGLPVGSGVAKAPASESSAADSMGLNAPLVEGRSQRLARRQMLFQEQPLGRLPRFEGLQCRSRLTKKRETHPIPVPPMPKIAIFCSLTLFCIFRTPLVLSAHLHAGQRRASIRRINRPDTRMHSAKCPVLDRE